MPNPTPRPFALNVYVSTPPSGTTEDISAMINRKSNPVIRFSADGLSSETTLPLRYTGSLPYSIQEWAEVWVEAVDNSEKLFRGYIGRLSSHRLGADRHLILSCVDGNIKLKRGVGRTVDGGTPGIIPTLLTFPAGTTDRAVIIAIFNAYLPDVDWSLVDNVFTLTEPFSVGYCSVYDALIELRKRAPALAKIRFYCSFRQSDWDWQFRWFDMVTIPTSGITLLEDPDPGAGEANYWTFQRVRDGIPIFNRWYVVGKDPVLGTPIIGSANSALSQIALGVILAGISENPDLGTVAECNAEAARLLTGKSQARESFTGLETHQPLLLTGPQAVYLKNDLEPGITTPQPFPVSTVEFSFPNMIPTYRADLGDRWLALGEEDEGRLYGTAPTRDLTAPDPPTWPGGSAWIVSNTYEANSNTAMLAIEWDVNTEGDLLRYRLYWRRYAGDETGSPLPWSDPIFITRPTTNYTLELPAGVLVGFKLEAEDTAGNISGPSAVVTTFTASDPIPKPTALTIVDYGIHHAGDTDQGTPSQSMFVKVTFDIGSYVPGEGSVFVVQANQVGGTHYTRATYPTATAQPLYLSGLRLGGVQYNITVWIRNAYNRSGPPSDPASFTTKRIYIPPRSVAWPSNKDDRGLVPGYENIATTGDALWDLAEDEGDQGGNAFVGTIANAGEKITLTQRPFGIVKARPLSWAFSVRAFTVADAPATGTFTYKIKWCSADLTVLNTQSIKAVVPPTIATYSQYEGKVDPYSGAVVAIVELEYGGTSVAETVYIGLVQLSDQQKTFNIATRAIVPTALNLLVPGVLQNGSMEQPSLIGDLPDGYSASGTWFYGFDLGTADGGYSVSLGGTTATHTLQTPYIFWTYPIRSALNYALRVRWHQYHVNAIGPTRGVYAVFFNSAFTQIGSAVKIKANDASTDFVVPTTPNPGFCEGVIPGSIIPADTAYIRILFEFITTTGTQLWSIDAIETAPAAMVFTANSIQYRSLGGALLSTHSVGPAFPSSPQADDTHDHTGHNLTYHYDGTRWLGPVVPYPMHNYLSAPPFTGTTEALAGGVPTQYQLLIVGFTVGYYVGGTNNATNYWNYRLRRLTVGISVDTVTTLTTAAGGPNVWQPPISASLAFVLNTTDIWTQVYIFPTGAPGATYIACYTEGRRIGA